MGRVLILLALTAVGLFANASTAPKPEEPIVQKEMEFLEDVTLEVEEVPVAAIAETQLAVPIEDQTPRIDVIPAEELQVAHVAALPCADGSCRRPGRQRGTVLVRSGPEHGLLANVRDNAQQRRLDRRERWASRPHIFGRRFARRC